jgi:hypothetical protein
MAGGHIAPGYTLSSLLLRILHTLDGSTLSYWNNSLLSRCCELIGVGVALAENKEEGHLLTEGHIQESLSAW